MTIELEKECAVPSLDLQLMEQAAEKVLMQEGRKEPYRIYLLLTDNEQMQEINLERRGIDSTTDVLSFPMFAPGERPGRRDIDPQTGEIFLGDIVISVPRAQQQAEEYGHSFQREMCYLTVHAMLHLLGYDHMQPDEKAQMRLREEKALAAMGLSRE